jgi:hypothetical protein
VRRSCKDLNAYRSFYLEDRDGERSYLIIAMLQKGDETPYRFIMPPVLGTHDDLKALAGFLESELEAGASETAAVP